MELVPPNSEKMTKFIEDSNISTKKVKVQVRACQIPNFVAKLQQKVKVSQTLTWTFTFLVGIFPISSELSNFSLLGGTSSILRTFLGGTSKKTHPVSYLIFVTGTTGGACVNKFCPVSRLNTKNCIFYTFWGYFFIVVFFHNFWV